MVLHLSILLWYLEYHKVLFCMGPLLFLIYIDSISQIHLSNNSKLVLYADDILLYKTISEACDFSCLQEDVNCIDFWSSTNAMTFNVSKCKQNDVIVSKA